MERLAALETEKQHYSKSLGYLSAIGVFHQGVLDRVKEVSIFPSAVHNTAHLRKQASQSRLVTIFLRRIIIISHLEQIS